MLWRKKKGCKPPDMGLEPMTLRLKVWCSTDWANRAGHHFQPVLYLPSKYWDRFSWERLYPVWIWILKNAHEKLLVVSTVLLVLKLLLYGIFPLPSRCKTMQRCESCEISQFCQISELRIDSFIMFVEHDYEKCKVRTVAVKGSKFQCLKPINLAVVIFRFTSLAMFTSLMRTIVNGCMKKRAYFTIGTFVISWNNK